jgi:predicted dehydrogenase
MNIRFGIVGLGRIAERFAAVMRTAKGLELSGVAARDEARAEAFARRFGAARVHESYSALIRDPGIDAVYIALTHNFHYEIAKLCLEQGKAVICEKPLVLTKKDAESLVSISRERKVLLMEAMWTRCLPAVRKAREWVAAGRIGPPKLVQAAFCFNAPRDPEGRLFNKALAGGALYDAGVYPIEFAAGVLGENPHAATGATSVGATGVDEYDSISLGFPSGAVASLACGMTARTPNDARVYGAEGSIVLPNFLGAKRAELFDGENVLVEAFESEFVDGFIFEIEHFAELYRAGKLESDLIPLKDSVACAGVFDALMNKWGLR